MDFLYYFWTFILIVPTLIISQDDFGFEEIKHNPLQRLWGVPDTTAQVGHLFHYQIPKTAFEGNIARFKAYSEKEGSLPSWLTFHEKSGILEGVATDEQLGEHYITVKAYDEDFHSNVKDIFAVEVLSKSNSMLYNKEYCKHLEEKTVLALVLDANFHHINPKERVLIIKNIAGFFNLEVGSIYLGHLSAKNEILNDLNDAVIDAGPGNVITRKSQSSSIIQWQVGCNGKIWNKLKHLVANVKVAAKDGTLAEVIQRPVIGWKLVKEESDFRKRRQINGKPHSHDENNTPKMITLNETPAFQVDPTPTLTPYSSNDFTDDNIEDIPSRIIVAITETPIFPFNPSPLYEPSSSSSHRHRHHRSALESLTNMYTLSTPTYIPERPGLTSVQVDQIVSSEILPTASSSVVTPTSPPFPTDSAVGREQDINSTSDSLDENSSWSISIAPSEPTLPDFNPEKNIEETREDEFFDVKNNPPSIIQRLEKKLITAGKSLKYQIPESVFNDPEDGNTRNLRVHLLAEDGEPLREDSWIQFSEDTQEIIALPLEEHISKWVFYLNATDSGNLTVGDRIEVNVQNHKGKRTVNHAISAKLLSVPTQISLLWQLSFLDAISKALSDPNSSQITVLKITTDPIVFTWTNDSLVRPDCSSTTIDQIYEKLLDENTGLQSILANEIKIDRIDWEDRGQCKSVLPKVPFPEENFPPVNRNQVDYLNATVGQLLVFTVPDDTFYDPEDGGTRQLKLSLVTIDRNPIPPSHWLQFDVKNQEFYGIPMPVNVGQIEYQLICEDKEGLTTNDGLVVNVHPAPRILYNVEFSMKLSLDYSIFMENPTLQRIFVQKLAAIFKDHNTNAIVLSGFTPGSTVITWHNKSLPTNLCPDNEIVQLRKILLGDDEKVTPHVIQLMLPEFQVLGARLTPTGLCQGALTEISPNGGETATSDVTAVSQGEQYIIGLLIPAIVIAVMLLCAGLVACILYRRRRTGKMSVGDEDERQTFRSKGIPVIFQDELDERPEPTNKSPVIMKEEKPPLPPPEYQRGSPLVTTALLSDTEDSPYQPPPPFTTSRDSARPKPTPTYRMPPPYVPP
ncbi:dystroglycan isoform X2 [Cimex lectularius]|nr:dystroglycan isoform X2 [Cimex lectularius]XP_014256304.1 dystroglycan isoform X2 [Cimex lectularius]